MRLMKSIICSVAVFLSACASVAPIRDAHNAADKVQFNMDARFGVEYIEKNMDKSLTGKMQWEETRRATDIILASPLGTAIASLHVTRNEAVVKTSAGDIYAEATPEELLDRLLGYELPLSSLRMMMGSPDKPLVDQTTINGWSVLVEKRFTNPNLAKKLLITRQYPTPVKMTLFIDERSDALEKE